MFSFKIVAVVLLAATFQIQCSVVHEPVPVAPAVRYTLVTPQNVRPFAAQVSTFTKGLNIYAAPYAAGVIGGPAIVSRNVIAAAAPAPAAFPAAVPYQHVPALAHAHASAPAPVLAPAPALATPYVPGQVPYYPGPVPAISASPYYPEQVAAFAPNPYYSGPVPALAASPYHPAASPAAYHPAGIAPAHFLPAPFARSVHAVSPAVGPAFEPHLATAPLLG